MKKYLIIVVLLSFSCAYYNTFFNAKKFFKEAEEERKKSKDGTITPAIKKKYTRVIEKASKLLEFYPKSKYVDDALFLLGKSFYYRQEYRKAKRKFEELIKNFPESEFVPEARLWLGKTNTELRDYDTAKRNFYKILNEKAKQEIHDEAQFLLGGLYFHKEDYLTALDEYKIAARKGKDKALRAKAYFKMGECYFHLKDYAAAAASFEKARKYSPDPESEFEASFQAGLALKTMTQYDKAIDIFTELLGDIANEEKWPQCLLEIADCLYLKGEIANAISWYETITTDHKRTDAAAKAYYKLGLIYQQDKSDYNQAKEYFDKAVKEYSRSEIVPQAKSNSKAIQNLLALKEDIKAQERKIEIGDSVAAAMDSLEFDATDAMAPEDSVKGDSLKLAQDSLNADFYSRTRNIENSPENSPLKRNNENLDNFPPGLNSKGKKTVKKVALKSGELGTPQEELIKDKLMLAEIYLFEFNQPDSALFEYLEVLQQDSSAEIAAKAAYSIAYIFDNFKNDETVADSIYRELIETYPNTIYAQKARERLKLPPVANDYTDVILQEFKRAEQEYFDKKNLYAALTRYEKIAANYPHSKFASKALFAMGWIYDNDLNQNDKALEIYEQLVKKYPDSNYSKKVKKKLEEVKKQENNKGKSAEALALQDKQKQQSDLNEQIDDNKVDVSDKEKYREMLRKEMDKYNPRLRNPDRIMRIK